MQLCLRPYLLIGFIGQCYSSHCSSDHHNSLRFSPGCGLVWKCVSHQSVCRSSSVSIFSILTLAGSCALQPLSGKLYQHFSLKWTYLSFLGIFELGSLLCGAARSSTMLIVGRAVAGMGAAGLFSGALTIVSHTIPLQSRPSQS
jgi:MFS family permease